MPRKTKTQTPDTPDGSTDAQRQQAMRRLAVEHRCLKVAFADAYVELIGIREENTRLNEIIQEGRGFDLLTMGRGEGPGCYCYVNDLLRQFLSRLKKSYAVVVIDNEAGMEHLSRLTSDNVDCLIVVSEPTAPSVRTVERILELADSLPTKIGRKALVFNKAKNGRVPDIVLERAQSLPVSASMELSHSQTLENLGERGGSIFELPGKLEDNPQLTRIVKWCLGGDNH